VSIIPRSGPWFEDGEKISGPKKPKIKPMVPSRIPPTSTYTNILFGALAFPVFFHIKIPIRIAMINAVTGARN
jgi:hypothetical protein